MWWDKIYNLGITLKYIKIKQIWIINLVFMKIKMKKVNLKYLENRDMILRIIKVIIDFLT